jgi:hypothetical protein
MLNTTFQVGKFFVKDDDFKKSENYLTYLKTYNNAEYKKWIIQKQEIIDYYDQMKNNNQMMYSLFEIHFKFLEQFLNKQFLNSPEIRFNNVFFSKSIDIDQEEKERIIKLLLQCIKFLPKSVHKFIKKYDLIFDDVESSVISPTSLHITIKLNQQNSKDIFLLAHDLIHELGHIMEYHLDDKKILEPSIKYLKKRSRIIDGNPVIKCHIKNKVTYENNLFYDGAGTICYDLFLNTAKPYTEVYSTGIGLLFYSPIDLYFNDPEYFMFILSKL